MNKILYNSAFKADPNGHGGNRRTSQIQELVNLAGLEICNFNTESLSKGSIYDICINAIQFLAKNKVKFSPYPRVIGACGHQYKIYKHYLEQHQSLKILLWEATRNYIASYVAKEVKFKLIAFPQNLESFVGHTDFFTRKCLPDSLENELLHLAKADAIFCISREEQWLLQLHGINADFLPYYPPQAILSNLLVVRQHRETLENNRFLILGTTANSPTLVGMIEQIKLLDQISKDINFHVDIAGYGTEKLKEFCQSPIFTLHGTVSSEKLNYLLLNAKAILIHQKATSGALTRIPEMLIAGIPVIGNSHACRSAFHYPGVYCYDNQVELAELMSQNLHTPPILDRPVAAENRFIQYLKHLAEI
jgi:glycosyltransferase involved in cell wall biosynthesis